MQTNNGWIHPLDPFENPTENHAFRTDYRDVEPRIAMPGYVLPLEPDRPERKRIRHYFNVVGLVLFLGVVFVNVAFLAVQMLAEYFMAGSADVALLVRAEEYITDGSVLLLAMNGLLFLIANTGSAVIGCHATGVRIRTLFQGNGTPIGAGTILRYLAIGIFIQAATGLLYVLLSELMHSAGIEDYTADIDSFSTFQSAAVTILYSCIVAPVTEELLYRGFVLKTMSRVSVRFGILCSALLFGLAHENLAQFLLAFPMGIFMARIDVKHNSLLPSIGVHLAVNTLGTVLSMLYELFSDTENMRDLVILGVGDLLYYAVALLGLVLWILEVRKNRLPANTVRQSYRGIRIAMTSPWLLVIVAIHLATAIFAVVSENL